MFLLKLFKIENVCVYIFSVLILCFLFVVKQNKSPEAIVRWNQRSNVRQKHEQLKDKSVFSLHSFLFFLTYHTSQELL